jgi:hypothetical protein
MDVPADSGPANGPMSLMFQKGAPAERTHRIDTGPSLTKTPSSNSVQEQVRPCAVDRE